MQKVHDMKWYMSGDVNKCDDCCWHVWWLILACVSRQCDTIIQVWWGLWKVHDMSDDHVCHELWADVMIDIDMCEETMWDVRSLITYRGIDDSDKKHKWQLQWERQNNQEKDKAIVWIKIRGRRREMAIIFLHSIRWWKSSCCCKKKIWEILILGCTCNGKNC